jgi:hypothetical protein
LRQKMTAGPPSPPPSNTMPTHACLFCSLIASQSTNLKTHLRRIHPPATHIGLDELQRPTPTTMLFRRNEDTVTAYCYACCSEIKFSQTMKTVNNATRACQVHRCPIRQRVKAAVEIVTRDQGVFGKDPIQAFSDSILVKFPVVKTVGQNSGKETSEDMLMAYLRHTMSVVYSTKAELAKAAQASAKETEALKAENAVLKAENAALKARTAPPPKPTVAKRVVSDSSTHRDSLRLCRRVRRVRVRLGVRVSLSARIPVALNLNLQPVPVPLAAWHTVTVPV